MSIGKSIRSARISACLTQEQLAKRCGLAPITIRQYELGKREPRYEQLKLIAKVLNLSLSSLIDFSETKEQLVSNSELRATALSDYLRTFGITFSWGFPDENNANATEANNWLCVDDNNQKLYLLRDEDVSICEQSIHSFVEYQLFELLKKGTEIPDKFGFWALNKKTPPQD